jgi:hypothetical protein
MKRPAVISVAVVALAAGAVCTPPAHADDEWVAVASSPSHEQVDFAWGVDQADVEAKVFQQCAVLERASDCRLLASGPDCVGIAWDGDQPINHAHGMSGGGREVVAQAAMAAAGPYGNDPEVRCAWDPHGATSGVQLSAALAPTLLAARPPIGMKSRSEAGISHNGPPAVTGVTDVTYARR